MMLYQLSFPLPLTFKRFCVGAIFTKLQISPLLPGLRMSTLAKNVSQVVLYENQVSDFVALLWMQTPLGPRTKEDGLLGLLLLLSFVLSFESCSVHLEIHVLGQTL